MDACICGVMYKLYKLTKNRWEQFYNHITRSNVIGKKAASGYSFDVRRHISQHVVNFLTDCGTEQEAQCIVTQRPRKIYIIDWGLQPQVTREWVKGYVIDLTGNCRKLYGQSDILVVDEGMTELPNEVWRCCEYAGSLV